ncbi:MAG: hypothetical protein AAF242_19935, partial [Bacteroidota bacterium]
DQLSPMVEGSSIKGIKYELLRYQTYVALEEKGDSAALKYGQAIYKSLIDGSYTIAPHFVLVPYGEALLLAQDSSKAKSVFEKLITDVQENLYSEKAALMESYQILSILEEKTSAKLAIAYYKEFQALYDDISSEKNWLSINEIQKELVRKKEETERVMVERAQLLALKQQNLRIITFSVALVLLGIAIGLVFYYYQGTNRMASLLSEKNREIKQYNQSIGNDLLYMLRSIKHLDQLEAAKASAEQIESNRTFKVQWLIQYCQELLGRVEQSKQGKTNETQTDAVQSLEHVLGIYQPMIEQYQINITEFEEKTFLVPISKIIMTQLYQELCSITFGALQVREQAKINLQMASENGQFRFSIANELAISPPRDKQALLDWEYYIQHTSEDNLALIGDILHQLNGQIEVQPNGQDGFRLVLDVPLELEPHT